MYMHKADLAKGFLKGAEKCWKWGRRRLVPETGYLATERNAQSNLRALGRDWGSPVEQWWENLERSGKPENIPAVGDPLQMHFCGEASSAEARDSPRPERRFGGCRTCSPARAAVALRGCPRPHDAAVQGGCSARHGSAAAVLPWQRGPARVVYSSQRRNSKISRFISADSIFPPVSKSCLPQNTWSSFFLPPCHIAIVLIVAEW